MADPLLHVLNLLLDYCCTFQDEGILLATDRTD